MRFLADQRIAHRLRQRIAAIATIVVERHRRKNERNGTGSGDRTGDPESGQVQAQNIEILLRKIDASPRRHIRRANDGKRTAAALRQITERRLAKQGVFELFLQ